MNEKKLGVVICSYNRPQYLRQCLESVAAADLSQVKTVMIVDDHSTDQETLNLINDFELPQVELIKAFGKENRSIKFSLQLGFNLLFPNHQVCTNLDSDAIILPDAFNRLLEMHKRFPGHIITGFNCRTKNKNGTERHVVVEEGDGYNMKRSVGGINMIFSASVYAEVVKPALEKSLKNLLNWDHQACITSVTGYGKNIVCCVPSCVQHIGVDSSMGHNAGGEPPDVADDFATPFQHAWTSPNFDVGDMPKYKPHNYDINLITKDVIGDAIRNEKLKLLNVTLVGADCVNVDRLIRAASVCDRLIQFGAIQMFSSIPSKDLWVAPIEKINSKEAYSHFIMKVMPRAIMTDFMLVIQHDGWVMNPDAWNPEWLNYDYIGAPWEWYTDGMQVGNGGFSLRSKKLMDIVCKDDKIFPQNDHLNLHKEEDHCICRIYRKYLEDNYGIKFAPVELARQFSIEGYRSPNKTWTKEFGFHGHGLTNIKP